MVSTVVTGINRALHTGIPGTFDDSPRMTVRVVGLPRPPSALKGIGRSIDAVCNRHYFSFRRDFSPLCCHVLQGLQGYCTFEVVY